MWLLGKLLSHYNLIYEDNAYQIEWISWGLNMVTHGKIPLTVPDIWYVINSYCTLILIFHFTYIKLFYLQNISCLSSYFTAGKFGGDLVLLSWFWSHRFLTENSQHSFILIFPSIVRMGGVRSQLLCAIERSKRV